VSLAAKFLWHYHLLLEELDEIHRMIYGIGLLLQGLSVLGIPACPDELDTG
jgi:hypothetical protein